MASLANFILFQLLVVIMIIPPFLLVSADEKLMEIQCHNTETPEICIKCLKSDPRSSDSNDIGIASIITTCLSKHAKNLAANLSKLVDEAPNKKLKSSCKACIKGYSKARQDLAKVISYLKSRDYDNAAHFVLTALQFELECRATTVDNINKYDLWRFPNNIAYEMKVYEYLSEAAMRIIDRF